MTTVISTALIVSAAILLVLSLLEVFLSDAKKRRINDSTVQLWNVLDELKARRLLDCLQTRRPWLLGTGVLFAVAFILWAESTHQPTGPAGIRDIILAFVVFGPGLWFGLTIARWILRATTLLRAVARATVSIVISLLPIPLAEIEAIFVLPHLPSIAIPDPTLGIALGQLLIITATLASAFFTAIAVIFWCPVAIPLALIYIASVLIFVAEFVLQRIAEYSRGVLAAVIVIVVALVAFLKVIG
jgi:hypothetical protein